MGTTLEVAVRTTAVVLFALSSSVFVAAAVLVARTWGVLRRGVTTRGTVVDGTAGPGARGASHAVVEYHRLSGEKVLLSSAFGLRSGRLRAGDQVAVVFEPSRPSNHRVIGFLDLWMAPLTLAAVAIVLALLGLIALL